MSLDLGARGWPCSAGPAHAVHGRGPLTRQRNRPWHLEAERHQPLSNGSHPNRRAARHPCITHILLCSNRQDRAHRPSTTTPRARGTASRLARSATRSICTRHDTAEIRAVRIGHLRHRDATTTTHSSSFQRLHGSGAPSTSSALLLSCMKAAMPRSVRSPSRSRIQQARYQPTSPDNRGPGRSADGTGKARAWHRRGTCAIRCGDRCVAQPDSWVAHDL
jgi:hypothetical protein